MRSATIDALEIGRFAERATCRDTPLIALNKIRIAALKPLVKEREETLSVLDVGCGNGILSE
ncbi:MAG: hypothetical protein MHPSP_004369, partial [Paramarteilia canceri]